MVIFVTGGTGFIGSHLVSRLKKRDRVVVLVHDDFRDSWLDEALSGTVCVRGDVRDLKELKRIISRFNVDEVYHLAAQAVVKTAYKDELSVFEVNALGTATVLAACRALDVERIYVQSTDKIFGNKQNALVDDRLVPTEPYGTSKVCADLWAQLYLDYYDMNILIARFCNIYGYDPYSDRIIPNTVRACIQDQPPVIYQGDASSRQYLYIDDALDAISTAMEKELKGIYNIGSQDELSQEKVVFKILEYFSGICPEYVQKNTREIYKQSVVTTLPGWEQKTSFSGGIRKTIALYKKYEHDWRRNRMEG